MAAVRDPKELQSRRVPVESKRVQIVMFLVSFVVSFDVCVVFLFPFCYVNRTVS